MIESEAKFLNFLNQLHIPLDKPIEYGRLVKYTDAERQARGKKDKPHWYIVFFNDKHIWAKAGSHDTSKNIEDYHIFKSYQAVELSPEQIEDFKNRAKEAHIAWEKERAEYKQECRLRNEERSKSWTDADPSHPYLVKKKLPPIGVKQWQDKIIIPAYDNGVLQSYQTIDANSVKDNATGPLKGCYCPIGDLQSSDTIYVGEGWSTACTAHVGSGKAAVSTFGAKNLVMATALLKDMFPSKRFIMLKDNNKEGEDAANWWKKLIKEEIVAPPEKYTDFNDLYLDKGEEAVLSALNLPVIEAVCGFTSIAAEIEPIEWIVQDLIDNESVNILYARGGTGKSLIAQQLAISISNGFPFMERSTGKPRRCLYVDCEMGRNRYNRRLQRAYQNNQQPERLPQSVCYDDLKKKGMGRINLSCPTWRRRMDTLFPRYDVIIIDSFNRSAHQDSEVSKEAHWRLIYDWLEDYRETKCILFVHHTNKNGEMAGSQQIYNDSDNTFEMWQDREYKGFRLAFQVDKGRDIIQQQFGCTFQAGYPHNGGWMVENNTNIKKPTKI